MSPAIKQIAANRKALRDFSVLERLETGIVLCGTEVKSIRGGNVNLTGGYAVVEGGQVFLHDVHIHQYEQGNQFNHESVRPRQLLLHKKEILKLRQQTAEKGHTIIPLKIYFRGGLIKVEVGVCKGKATHDKREDIKRKTADREAQRAVAQHRSPS